MENLNSNVSTASNNLVFTRYFEIDQFEDKLIIQDYICPLCTGVYNNPVVDGCGHVFCSECINLSLTKSVYCPISYRDMSKDSCHQIPFISSIISKHIISCKNKCGWKKPLNNYQQHLDEECPNILLNCKFANCKVCYLRSEKEVHEAGCEWRLIECEHCKSSVAYVEMQKHFSVCPKIRVSCGQDCGIEIERIEMENHVKLECKNTLVECMLAVHGCASKYKRAEELQHYEDAKLEHYSVISKCLKESAECKVLKEKIERLEEFNELLQQRLSKLEHSLNKGGSNEVKGLANRNMNNGDLNLKENQRDGPGHIYKRESSHDKNENHKEKYDLLNKKRLHPESNGQRDANNSNKKLKNLNDHHVNRVANNPKNLIDDYSESEEDIKDPNSDAILKIDKVGSSDNLHVIGNKVICNSVVKNVHKFVFLKINSEYYLKNQIICWNLTINKKSAWMGFGMAKRQKVIDNNYKFAGSGSDFDHGCFLVSSNGFLWNSNLKSQNNSKVQEFIELGTGETMKLKFNRTLNTLEISYSKIFIKLESVSSDKDDLYPCVIMMGNGDELSFSLANNN